MADAGPIISFARIGRLDLLREIVGGLIVPPAVYEELVKKGKSLPGTEEITRASWITCQPLKEEKELTPTLPPHLGQGERDAIALTMEIQGVLLIDDLAAKREAQRRGLSTFGTLRLLREAKEKGLIQKARPIVDALRRENVWISDPLYHHFLKEIGEV